MSTVLASGVFDILHPGHLYYLTESKKLGDRLVVVVTSDETARRQGKKPLFCEASRREIIAQLKMVDDAVVGRVGKAYESILDIWPEVIALGWDQFQDSKPGIQNLEIELQHYNWQGRIVRIGKMPKIEISSSHIKDAIINSKLLTSRLTQNLLFEPER